MQYQTVNSYTLCQKTLCFRLFGLKHDANLVFFLKQTKRFSNFFVFFLKFFVFIYKKRIFYRSFGLFVIPWYRCIIPWCIVRAVWYQYQEQPKQTDRSFGLFVCSASAINYAASAFCLGCSSLPGLFCFDCSGCFAASSIAVISSLTF